jgi:phosphatidylinositol 4-kinase B
MQLINRFQYEVISLGPDCGIIEMLNDITTLNSLFEKLYNRGLTLRQFFDKVYPDPQAARRNFMKSLAGYSILTYFLQVKDRHNGNILLSRDGSIIHIDFGFFLSNAPGKGVELEKKVPFKLLTEYVEVIGELDSHEFFEFRQLFYKGFRAVLKEKEAILTLVRMMYSSHMESMGCFIKGEFAISELEQRFSIEQGVESFCYTLINSSLDNWRARWYDKFQYFLQKIYY